MELNSEREFKLSYRLKAANLLTTIYNESSDPEIRKLSQDMLKLLEDWNEKSRVIYILKLKKAIKLAARKKAEENLRRRLDYEI